MQGRSHLDFVCRLRELLPSRGAMLDDMVGALAAARFDVEVGNVH